MSTRLAPVPRSAQLFDNIRRSASVTSDLMSEFIAVACKRLAKLNKASVPATRIDTLMEDSAWLEAAFALAKIELPGWTLRRLIQDDGIWLCSLSRQPLLPIELDETVEGAHECMTLAILAAVLEAQIHTVQTFTPAMAETTHSHAMCCDNFA
jgi:hypothetical protein